MRRWAVAHGVLDVANSRSSHAGATPRAGGLAILLVTAAGAAVALALWPADAPSMWPVAGAFVVLAGVSVVDDIWRVPSLARLAVHAAVASMLVRALGPWPAFALPFAGALDPAAAAVVSVLWIVAAINAYNFMDGIDGIAATQAVVAAMGWAALAVWLERPATAAIALAAAGAAAGFLAHNAPRARIFMGDVGSTFLGCLFAAVTLPAFMPDRRAPVAALIFLWPFVFDTAFTLARRAAARENLLRAHRSHLYQRIARKWGSHGKTTVLYGGLAAGCAAAALTWVRRPEIGEAALAISVTGSAAVLLWIARGTTAGDAPGSLS